jgi:hypothetical protein
MRANTKLIIASTDEHFTNRVKLVLDRLTSDHAQKWNDYDEKKAAYDLEWKTYRALPWYHRWNTLKPIIHYPIRPFTDWDMTAIIPFRNLYAELIDPDIKVKEIDEIVFLSLLSYELDFKIRAQANESSNPI